MVRSNLFITLIRANNNSDSPKVVRTAFKNTIFNFVECFPLFGIGNPILSGKIWFFPLIRTEGKRKIIDV